MSSNTEIAAGKAVEQIAEFVAGKRMPVMSGKVVAGSLDETQGTVSVVLCINDEDSPTPGVLLNGVTQNDNGVIEYPADGSDVWVARIDGQGKYGIVKCTQLVKVVVKIGEQTLEISKDGHVFNGGNLKGMVVLDKLVERLNKVEKAINDLKQIFSTWVPVANDGGAALKAVPAMVTWMVQTLAETTGNDIEDKKVKH